MVGMNVEEKQDMCRFILDANDQFGTMIVLIEHHGRGDGHLGPRRCSTTARRSATAPDEVRNNEVIRAYLGTSH